MSEYGASVCHCRCAFFWALSLLSCIFFFFQAEDGIRDLSAADRNGSSRAMAWLRCRNRPPRPRSRPAAAPAADIRASTYRLRPGGFLPSLLYALLECVFPEANNALARCRLPSQVLNWHEI